MRSCWRRGSSNSGHGPLRAIPSAHFTWSVLTPTGVSGNSGDNRRGRRQRVELSSNDCESSRKSSACSVSDGRERGRKINEVKRLTKILCLILFLIESPSLPGREPTKPKNARKTEVSQSASRKLVWNANPSEERIICYNVYEKIDDGRHPPVWKKIGTVRSPSFTVQKVKPGSHVFGVTAVSQFGESPRQELVVTR